MFRILLFISFSIVWFKLAAQDTIRENIKESGDTIYQKRTVERVVYVYAAPEHYLSARVKVDYGKAFYSGSNVGNDNSYMFSGTACVQYQKGVWQFSAGTGLSSYHRKQEYSTTQFVSENKTYIHTDTLSWYDVEKDDQTQRHYITQEYIRDTVLINSFEEPHTGNYTYQYLIFPMSVGRQLKHGFFCVDATAGLVPGILVSHTAGSVAYTDKKKIIPEDQYLRSIICSVDAGITMRYLLTFSTFISLHVNYSLPLVAMHSRKSDAPLRVQTISAGLSLSYLLFERK